MTTALTSRETAPRRAFDWLLRNRETGQITIVQMPNVPLGIFLVAAVVRRVVDPSGWPRTALTVVATAALTWWAVDELVRGVNPLRRILGGVVLALLVFGLVTSM
jgi:hypothetical protein